VNKFIVGFGPNVDLQWIRQNQDRIQDHAAWHGYLSEEEAEDLLKNKKPFTYLFRRNARPISYFISFVQADHSIKHMFFVLEMDRKIWLYESDPESESTEKIMSPDLDELIPMLMQCDPSSSTPLVAVMIRNEFEG
jgi:hypothetical protein